jgi:pyruvate formate lyase activating enzyme
MVFGGLLKFSAIDYPDHLSGVVFTQGCNWRCPFCHNPELIPRKAPVQIDSRQIFDFLKSRQDFLEGICITGGEPTIQPDLIDFIKAVKNLDYKVKLDTNGSNPELVKKIVREASPDMLAMDVKTSWRKYSSTVGIKLKEDIFKNFVQLVEFIEYHEIDLELRTTLVPNLVDEQDIMKIGEWLGGKRKYVLQQFRPEITYNPKFINLSPYSPDEVNQLAEISEQFFSSVTVRGIG